MPELPEVNRVVNILKRAALNRTVEEVITTEDSIVYTNGITNLDFVSAHSVRVSGNSLTAYLCHSQRRRKL